MLKMFISELCSSKFRFVLTNEIETRTHTHTYTGGEIKKQMGNIYFFVSLAHCFLSILYLTLCAWVFGPWVLGFS